MSFTNLPYADRDIFQAVGYAKAAAIREPIRDAINSARAMHSEKMADVVYVLETALAHIKQETEDATFTEEAPALIGSDPLDELLGPAT